MQVCFFQQILVGRCGGPVVGWIQNAVNQFEIVQFIPVHPQPGINHNIVHLNLVHDIEGEVIGVPGTVNIFFVRNLLTKLIVANIGDPGPPEYSGGRFVLIIETSLQRRREGNLLVDALDGAGTKGVLPIGPPPPIETDLDFVVRHLAHQSAI